MTYTCSDNLSPCLGASPCLLLQPKAEQLLVIFAYHYAGGHNEIGLPMLKDCRGRGPIPLYSAVGELFKKSRSLSRYYYRSMATTNSVIEVERDASGSFCAAW